MNNMCVICHQDFIDILEDMTFVITISSPLFCFNLFAQSFQTISLSIELFCLFFHVQIEVTKHKVLSWRNDRLTILRTKDVVGTKHQNFCFCSCHFTKRKMDSHLVTVEVGIEGRTYERMNTDCTSFNKTWEECLDTKSMQSRCTVQEYRVSFNNTFNTVPHTWVLSVDQSFSSLWICRNLLIYQFVNNKRLIQRQCHFLWKTTLPHLQVWTDRNNGTAREVDTLT